MDAKIVDLMYDHAFELLEKYLKEGDSINLSKKKSGLASLLTKKQLKRNIMIDKRYIRLKAYYNQTTKKQNNSLPQINVSTIDFKMHDEIYKEKELPLNSPIRQRQLAANNFLKHQLELEKKAPPKEKVDALPFGLTANMIIKP